MRAFDRSGLPTTARVALGLAALLAAILVFGGCEETQGEDTDLFDARIHDLWTTCEPLSTNGSSNDTPSPALEHPPTGTGAPILQGTAFDPASVGYVQTEYFFSGEALGVTSGEALGEEGRWTTGYSSAAAPFKSRMVVMRPIDPADFSGTVFVEWLNVSAGFDAAPDWGQGHVEMIRRGHAWVGVSAQLVGIEGGGGLIPGLDLSLKGANPARYGTLAHPGDGFSYDIFSQAGMAVRAPRDIDPLDGLVPERVVATGESQAAMRMVTYVNGVDPIARVFDAFLVHSRLGGSPPLSEEPEPVIDVPIGTKIRSDARVPVFVVQTETDVIVFGSIEARRRDGAHYRLWEIAGTAHADGYTLGLGFNDVGGDVNTARVFENAAPIPGIIECAMPVNHNPAHHFVFKAAIRAMNEWVECGQAPPQADRLATSGDPPGYDFDAVGNVLGGIRTPYVDAPLAVHAGGGQTGLCVLFGTTDLLGAGELAALYTNDAAYRAQAHASLDAAVAGGFILDDDAPLIEQAIDEISFDGGVAP